MPYPRPDLDRDANARFQSLVELLPVALYTCAAPSGKITYYNANAVKLWGREPPLGDTDERFCGSFRLWRLDGSPLRHDETPMAQALLEGRSAHNEQVVIERPDGSRVTVLVNIDPIFDATGGVVGAVNVFHDTTLLNEHGEARARLAAIVESSDDAIISKDLNGVIATWNRGAERLFGYSASEAIGQAVTMLIPEERHNEEPGILDRVRRGERVDHYETVRRRKDGSVINVSLTVSPIFNENGKVIGASKIARDITTQKEAAARIELDRQAMSRFHAIGELCVRPGNHFIENLSEILEAAVWISEADKGFIQLHDEASRVLSIAVHRGFEAPFLDFFAVTGNGQSTAGNAAFTSGKRVLVENVETSEIFAGQASLKVLRDAGIRAVQSTPLISGTGTVLGTITTHFSGPLRLSEREFRLLDLLARQTADYMERRGVEEQREELLRAAERSREQAEAANVAKDEFLAMLGHELRNPLSAVRNSIAVARLDELNRPRALEIADRGANQLGRIVDDILDVARITRGRVPLRKARISLNEVLQRTVDAAHGLMGERGHSLTLSLPPERVRLHADAARVEQAITNLLANAAKYTDPGGTVTATLEQDGGDAVIRVRDDGIGIAPDLLPRVFDLFVQADRSLDRAQGGLGIGLTLVRRIVELHGGSVAAKSSGVGHGAEFALRFPALASSPTDDEEAAPAEHEETAHEPHLARALIVEDNEDVADALTMVLEMFGHDVRVVRDGLAALEAARADEPDIMLIDIGLPKMNGYEVAKAIRGDAKLKHLVLVALTGYGRSDDKSKAKTAGFDHHLTKPVDLERLRDVVARFASRERANGVALG